MKEISMNKKTISLEELKQIELQTLREIHKLCTEQGWRYSLVGGTLIGAVRHGGFIPWDDDIDICMPRPDYNKLIEYCQNNETPFRLICTETEKQYSYLFAKAVNPNTTIIEEGTNRNNIDMGVYIDIFPIDGLADDLETASKEFSKNRFNRELLIAYNWKKYFRSKTKSIVYEPIRFAFFVMSRFVNPQKLITKIQKQFPEDSYDKYEYLTSIGGAYRMRETMSKNILMEYTDIQFEGETFRAFKDYHSYLSHIYGDYMKLPAPEHQVSHHTFEAFWKE